MIFCNDVDLLYWEPDVMKEAAFASQTLDVGSGDVAGNLLTVTSGPSLTDQKVAAGQVIVFSGAMAGSFPITGVSGPFSLRFSALYDELFPDSGSPPDSVGVGSVSGVDFVVRTFWAQRKVVSDFLSQAVGIVPGTAQAQTASVLNPRALRRAATLGTLQMIYNAMAAAASEPAKFSLRADLYERLYRRALRQAQVDVDLDGDGKANVRRSPGLVRMARE
jgi:hypothetical protein